MPQGSTVSSNSDNSIKSYVPPKGWDDITVDEKIERMREIIRSLSSQLANKEQDYNWLKNLFFKHTHGDKGEILTIPETHRQSGYELGGQVSLTAEKPYF